eukprot:TRINITY_DN31388_c0_g1_i1.p1 TRINITY_DN31388_c0_g1~~TRINITY_DN31388_c0_g1_i1.p1  ORF type:complete len:395 (+),score=63.43 TRINITY_DN31388_c0_g1_i1:153-1187(+)
MADAESCTEVRVSDVSFMDRPWVKSLFSLALYILLPMLLTVRYGNKLLCARDGFLAVRMAAWGVIPHTAATISVTSLCALLELRGEKPMPAIRMKSITDEQCAALGEAIKKYASTAQTQLLSLPPSQALSQVGIKNLCRDAFAAPSRLTDLDLAGNAQLGDALPEALAPWLRGPRLRLQGLQLQECGLSARSIEAFGKLGLSGLQRLDLSWNSIRGSGAGLVQVLDAPMLRQLRLAYCDLCDEDISELAPGLAFCSLSFLSLLGNCITEVGVAALANHLAEAPKLEKLDLRENKISHGEALGRLAAAWAGVPGRAHKGTLAIRDNCFSKEETLKFQDTLMSMAI